MGRQTTVAMALVLLQGCAGGDHDCGDQGSVSVDGRIGGKQVPLSAVFFFQTEDGLEVNLASDGDEGCRDWCEAIARVTGAASDSDAVWAESYPQRFWKVDIALQVPDVGEDLTGLVAEGAPWSADPGQMITSFRHYSDYVTESSYGNSHFSRYTSDGGYLEITSYQPGESLGGVLVTDVVTDDPHYGSQGTHRGHIEIAFTATNRCKRMESL